jgi:hypothetical protein
MKVVKSYGKLRKAAERAPPRCVPSRAKMRKTSCPSHRPDQLPQPLERALAPLVATAPSIFSELFRDRTCSTMRTSFDSTLL